MSVSVPLTSSANVHIIKKYNEPTTEGLCNRLHYRTHNIILLALVLVTCLEWVANGTRINCILEWSEDDWHISKEAIEIYCYVLSTFTLPRDWASKVGQTVTHVGVGAYQPGHGDVQYKAYYQWVPFVLLLQVVLFYIPHQIHKNWEGGKLQSILSGLNRLVLNMGDNKDKEKMMASYLADSLNTHNLWALKIILIELINLVNVVGNMYLLDVFLGGEFSTYGLQVVSFLEADPETRVDPMARVFPRVTKCSFYKHGASGSVQISDSQCILPLNSINEKIFVFLWFWFVFLSMVTIVSMVYHVFMMVVPGFTKMLLVSRTMNQSNLHLDDLSHHFEMGDWKLLSMLSVNLHPSVFGQVLKELHIALQSRKDSSAFTDETDETCFSDRKNSILGRYPILEEDETSSKGYGSRKIFV